MIIYLDSMQAYTAIHLTRINDAYVCTILTILNQE